MMPNIFALGQGPAVNMRTPTAAEIAEMGEGPTDFTSDGVAFRCGCEFRCMGESYLDIRWRKCDAHKEKKS